MVPVPLPSTALPAKAGQSPESAERVQHHMPPLLDARAPVPDQTHLSHKHRTKLQVPLFSTNLFNKETTAKKGVGEIQIVYLD